MYSFIHNFSLSEFLPLLVTSMTYFKQMKNWYLDFPITFLSMSAILEGTHMNLKKKVFLWRIMTWNLNIYIVIVCTILMQIWFIWYDPWIWYQNNRFPHENVYIMSFSLFWLSPCANLKCKTKSVWYYTSTKIFISARIEGVHKFISCVRNKDQG